MTDPADTAAWNGLDDELARWRRDGRELTLWWRDDDAVAATPALARLIALSALTTTPLALAVIPAKLHATLAPALARNDLIAVLQHGWSHTNHAKAAAAATTDAKQRAAEVGMHRGPLTILDELGRGRAVLADAFADQFVAALVPPWNRIDPALIPELPGAGLTGLSTFAARTGNGVHKGLAINNAHVDPIDWKAGPSFRGAACTLAQLINHLAARRSGAADPAEATGLLTHHLDMDAATWAFAERLIGRLRADPSARFVHARNLFAPAARPSSDGGARR